MLESRKARFAAATAKLVETPISTHRCKQARKVAVPAAMKEHKLARTISEKNSETAVPTVKQDWALEWWGRAETNLPSPYLESTY